MPVDVATRFEDAARRHGTYTIEGNAKATNVAYKALMGALTELREAPDRGMAVLVELLSHSDPSVVVWSARFLLPLDEPRASTALSKIGESQIPFISLGARVTLSEWHAGRLDVE